MQTSAFFKKDNHNKFPIKNSKCLLLLRKKMYLIKWLRFPCYFLTLFLPGEGGISPYMNVTWPLRLGIGLTWRHIFKSWFRFDMEFKYLIRMEYELIILKFMDNAFQFFISSYTIYSKNGYVPHCLDLVLNGLLTRRNFWCIPGMLEHYTIPK